MKTENTNTDQDKQGNVVNDTHASIQQDRKTQISQIYSMVWKACNIFRRSMDAHNYRDFILMTLFLKYISDIWDEHYEQLSPHIRKDKVRTKDYMKEEKFVMPEGTRFKDIYKIRNSTSSLGDSMDSALEKIENANKSTLEGIFQGFKYNNPTLLGQPTESNEKLRDLLEVFNQLNLCPSMIKGDIIGAVYIYLIEKFASEAGKKSGEFYTPQAVSELLAKLATEPINKKTITICDPTCGSGSLLLEAAQMLKNKDKKITAILHGMEVNNTTWALCKMNMFLHDYEKFTINKCDTLTNPTLTDKNGKLETFDVLVANPPFSLRWDHKVAADDKFKRFFRGSPPNKAADWAFITHMIATAKSKIGRVAVVAPHGALFRGSSEEKIRQAFVEENILDAVIGLPAKLFPTTSIPVTIMVFDKSREREGKNAARKDVFFIDASREFKVDSKQNLLQHEHIEKIMQAYKERKDIDKYARRVPIAEIKENEYNLHIPLYVDTFEEEYIDICKVQQEVEQWEEKFTKVQKDMKKHLKDLSFIN